MQQAVQGITDLINLPALINLDFADVQTVMTDKGIAHIGWYCKRRRQGSGISSKTGNHQSASGDDHRRSISCDHQCIRRYLIDANEAASYVQEQVGEDANVIFGAMYDSTNSDEVSITVIATGLQDNANKSVLPNYRPVTQKAPQPHCSRFNSNTESGKTGVQD